MSMNKSTWLVMYEQETSKRGRNRQKEQRIEQISPFRLRGLEMSNLKEVPSDNRPGMK